MNGMILKIVSLAICLLVCGEIAAQKLPASSSLVLGVPETIRHGAEEVDPRRPGGAGEGYWKIFVSPEGRFKVLFPVYPERKEREVTRDNTSISFTSIQGRSMRCELSYFDLPKSIQDAGAVKTILDETRDRISKEIQLGLSSEVAFSSEGYPGREVSFENDRILFKARWLIVDRRFYRLHVYAANTKGFKSYLERKATEFFNSFKFVLPGQESALTKGAVAEFENADFTGQSLGPNYESKYFGLKLDLTDDWKSTVYGQTGGSLAYRNINVRFLFTTGKKNLDKEQVIVPFLALGIEQLPNEKTTAAAYLEASKRSLAEAGFNPRIKREIHPQKLNGVDFFVMETETQQRGHTVKDKIFATIRKGVMLFFVLQSATEEDMKALSELVHRIKID